MATLDRERVINLAFGWISPSSPLRSGLPIIRDERGCIQIGWFEMLGCPSMGVIASAPINRQFHGTPASYALDEEYRGDINPLDKGAPKSKKAAKR